MKSTAKPIERCQVELHIEAEPPEYEAAQSEAFRHMARRVEVPGFRKGKAPRHIVEQHIGKEAIADEAVERLFPTLYEQALATHEIHPVMMPHVHLDQRDPPVFVAVVPLKPEVELGDYRSVRVAQEEATVTDEHVTSALDRIRESQAALVPVERSLQFGDFALLDVEATVDDQTILDHKEVTYEVVEGGQMPIPGFAEAIVGLSGGESREFTLQMPDDFRIADLASKECTCNVTVRQVRQKELPELGDDMAKSFGFESLDMLRERVGSDLESKARNEARSKLIQSALDAIAAQANVDFPPVLEEKEIEDLLAQEAKRYGYKNVEDYLKMSQRPLEQIREDLRPLAHKRITNGLILDRLAALEEIAIDETDVDNRIEELLAEAQDKDKMREFLASPQMRDSIADRLRTSRTLDRLVSIVTGDVEQVSDDESDAGASEEGEDE